MPAFAMTLPITRSNPTVIPRRDLTLSTGDGVALTLNLVDSETPLAQPVDLRGLGVAVRLVAWRGAYPAGVPADYGAGIRGGALWSVFGQVNPGIPGRVDIAMPREMTQQWAGNAVCEVQMIYAGQQTTLCRGAISLRAGPVLSLDPVDVLNDTYAPVLGDKSEQVEV